MSARAKRIRMAVDEALKRGTLARPGPRIEELLGQPIAKYPDHIISLNILPTMDGFRFLGWTANFDLIEVTQFVIDGKLMNSADEELVGWKPIRKSILTTEIYAKTT